MSEGWRLLADDGAGAAEGLALDEALMSRYAREEPDCAPTLRLYSYRDHCALIGRYQNLEAEVDLAACARTGTEVSRRLTGEARSSWDLASWELPTSTGHGTTSVLGRP